MKNGRFKIEKGIKLPPARGGDVVYPFGEMNVGDSFFAQIPRTNVAAAASLYGKRKKQRFATRKEKGGVRVWRTK